MSLQTVRLSLYRIVQEARVALGGDNRRMAEDLLEGGETTTALQPSASERVPQLVHVAEKRSGSLNKESSTRNGAEFVQLILLLALQR